MLSIAEALANLRIVVENVKAPLTPVRVVKLPVTIPIDEIKCEERLTGIRAPTSYLGHVASTTVQTNPLLARLQSGEVRLASEVRTLQHHEHHAL